MKLAIGMEYMVNVAHQADIQPGLARAGAEDYPGSSKAYSAWLKAISVR